MTTRSGGAMDLTPEEIDEFEALMAASSLGTPDGTDHESVPAAVREELHAVATALFSPGDADPADGNPGPAAPEEASVLETALGRLTGPTGGHTAGADGGVLLGRGFEVLAGLHDGDSRRLVTSSVHQGRTIFLLIDGNSRTLALALYEPTAWRASSAIHSFIRSAVAGIAIAADRRNDRWDQVRKYLTAPRSQTSCHMRLSRDSLAAWRSTGPPTALSLVEQLFNDRRPARTNCCLSVELTRAAWRHASPPLHLSIPQELECTGPRSALPRVVNWLLPSTDGLCGALPFRWSIQESDSRLWMPDRESTSWDRPVDSWNIWHPGIYRWPVSGIEATTLSPVFNVPLATFAGFGRAVTDWNPPFGGQCRQFSNGLFCDGRALATSWCTARGFDPLHLEPEPDDPYRSLLPDDGGASARLARDGAWASPGVAIRRDPDGQIIIESDVEARLAGAAGKLGEQASVPTRLIYRTSDPYAMEMHFQQSDQDNVSWYFARELLSDALRDGQSGLGDVRFRKDESTKSPTGREILMQLSSGDATAELLFQSRELSAFMGAAATVVPIGSESVHTDRAFKELESAVLNTRTSR